MTRGVRAVEQPRIMRDPLWRLQSELEVRGGPAAPARKDRRIWRAIEGVVDLDGREPLGVVRQHLRGRESLRVEAPPPLGVGVSAGSDPDGQGSCGRRSMIVACHQPPILSEMADGVLSLARRLVEARKVVMAIG